MSREPADPRLNVEDTVAGSRPARVAEPEQTPLVRGTEIGRYVVLAPIGAGAMGAVFAAYDPELDRKVAIKILHGERAKGERGSVGRTRLLREAQALAKLDHPNVVRVYDVGTLGERVWIAMAFVQGETLRQWALRQPRGWREVLEVMHAAGTGLAVAHDAGLLHRDFKPDNVMIGDDGRVHVMDFGLALREHDEVAVDGVDSELKPQLRALAVDVTGAGAVIGTPAYMAAEQLLGRRADARGDQHAFSVSLWELLWGERPVPGAALPELLEALLGGERRSPDPRRGVPKWLRRICERGLSRNANDRYPSMRHLLDGLERGRRRARLGRLVRVGGAVTTVVVAGVLWAAWQERERLRACATEAAAIDDVYDAQVSAEITAQLGALDFEFARVGAAQATAAFDRSALAWRSTAMAACDSRDAGTIDRATYERAAWCLAQRRLEFSSAVDELRPGDTTAARKASKIASGLADPSTCLDAKTLLASTPMPDGPDARDAVEAIRVELAAALRAKSPKHTSADALADLQTRAQALQWPPLVAEIVIARAHAANNAAEYEEAATRFTEGYDIAARASAWSLAAEAGEELMRVLSLRLARPDEAIAWERHAAIAAAQAGDPLGLHEANRLTNRGVLEHGRGHMAESRAALERALELRRAAYGSEHPSLAMSLSNLASAHVADGDYAAARTILEDAVGIATAVLGSDHPEVASAMTNLAQTHRALGDFERAKTLMERSLVIREALFGPEHPEVGQTLTALGGLFRSTGDFASARAVDERALAIREKKLPAGHPDIAASLNNLGSDLSDLGETAKASASFERSLAMLEAARGPDHADLAAPLGGLADVRKEQGELAEAARLLERALKIRETSLGPGHPRTVPTLATLASVREKQGDNAAARMLLERAIAIEEATEGTDPLELAQTLVHLADIASDRAAADNALARALAILAAPTTATLRRARLRWRIAQELRDRDTAAVQARLARDDFAAFGETATVTEIDAWLARP